MIPPSTNVNEIQMNKKTAFYTWFICFYMKREYSTLTECKKNKVVYIYRNDKRTVQLSWLTSPYKLWNSETPKTEYLIQILWKRLYRQYYLIN